MTEQKLTLLKDRNILRVILIAEPILNHHGLSNLEGFRPDVSGSIELVSGTIVWRADRVWMTRKTREFKRVTYPIIHYPRCDVYQHMTDEQYALEVVRQLDEILYREAFAKADVTADGHAKRKERERAKQKLARERHRGKLAEKAAEPPKPNVEDWESF